MYGKVPTVATGAVGGGVLATTGFSGAIWFGVAVACLIAGALLVRFTAIHWHRG